MSDSYDDYEAKIQLAEHAWEKRVDEMVKTEHDKQIEIAQAYERGWNAALAQQEPVAYLHNETELLRLARRANSGDFDPSHWRPLYTTPQRKPLSDEEIYAIRDAYAWHLKWGIKDFARAIEAAHGIVENI